MAERQTDRQPTPGKDPSAQDGAAPLRETPPITQPRLTLPSLPRAGRPSRRLLPPRPPSSSLAGQGLLHKNAQQNPASVYSSPVGGDAGATRPRATPAGRDTGAVPRPAAGFVRDSKADGAQRPFTQPLEDSADYQIRNRSASGVWSAPIKPPTSSDAFARVRSAPAEPQQVPPRQPLPNRPSASGARSGPLQIARQPTLPPRRPELSQPVSPPKKKGVVLISAGQQEQARARRAGWGWRSVPGRVRAAVILCLLVSLSLAIVFGGVLKGGVEPQAVQFAANGGSASYQQPTSVITLPPGLNTTDAGYYIAKYGFDAPKNVGSIPADERQRLAQMMPYALAATARYDARYQARVEPEMLLWWTHEEGIGARINYSNCANEAPPAGQTYFSAIMNCDRPDFWQLGYGNQFGNIWVLKDAFTDMHGNPNDPALVQKVGQAVLDYDMSQHTTPLCGGYSCTFPAMTIDQIMADVHWHASDHKETISNWWASVLSRDPGINSYMLAVGLTGFSHQETKNWVGCYYQEPCWQYESDSLWEILAIWKSLGG